MNTLCCVVNFKGERHVLEAYSINSIPHKKFMIYGYLEDGSVFSEIVNYDDVEFIGIDDPENRK